MTQRYLDKNLAALARNEKDMDEVIAYLRARVAKARAELLKELPHIAAAEAERGR